VEDIAIASLKWPPLSCRAAFHKIIQIDRPQERPRLRQRWNPDEPAPNGTEFDATTSEYLLVRYFSDTSTKIFLRQQNLLQHFWCNLKMETDATRVSSSDLINAATLMQAARVR
jgi:hypothetical protein